MKTSKMTIQKRLCKGIMIMTALALFACNPVQNAPINNPQSTNLEKVRIALLVPQSNASTADLANSLKNAARLAVEDLSGANIELQVYDTAGNDSTAETLTAQAIEAGADIILGPLFGNVANKVGLVAAQTGTNVLSFSNNSSIAGGNVYLLGQTFDDSAKRIVKFAADQGKQRAVIAYPKSVEGEFAKFALERAAAETSLEIVSTQGFDLSREAVANTVPLIKAAVDLEDADLVLLTSTTAGALGLLVQMLPEVGVKPDLIQYAGLARWDVPVQNLDLPGVQGGWFPVPDQTLINDFSARYEARFESKPHELASLAYDGVAAIGALALSGQPDALSAQSLQQPAGFEGVNGIFRFKEDGTNERGLAIAQIVNKQVEIIDPAPQSFDYSGY